jgi:serine/threonine protein kinase
MSSSNGAASPAHLRARTKKSAPRNECGRKAAYACCVRTPVRIGHWEFVQRLGGGGNADVYLTRDGEREVALKVLKTKNAESEAYARFRNEIDVLRRFQDDPGILPILDASLPVRPSRRDPAWIAMPRATLIRDALEGAALREKVGGMWAQACG